MVNNLFSNLLTFFIIGFLFAIIYCRVTGKTLGEMIREIREGFTPQYE